MILLVHAVSGAQRIARRCEHAASAGVREGMSLAHARALLADVAIHVEDHDEGRDDRALVALALWAQRFSPVVTPDAPDGLLLDVGGCERLFHGERRLVNQLGNSLRWLGVHARIAVADTFGCAWAVARFGEHDRTVVEAGTWHDALAPLPVHGLRLEPDTCAALHEVGLTRIEHLLELPRLELASRFGPDLLLRLDQALGEAIEHIEPIRRHDPPRVERVFDGPVQQLEGITQTVHGLVETLATRLQTMECGVRRLDLELERTDAPPVRVELVLSRPSRNVRHLWTLLRPKVETANLGFGVERVTLTATHAGRLPHEQSARWPAKGGGAGDAHRRRALGEFVDTVTGRLGAQATVHVAAVESHVPERAFRYQRSALGDETRTAVVTASIVGVPRPSVLLARPEPIDVIALVPDGPPSRLRWRGITLDITVSTGPERLAGEWWDEGSDEAAKRRSDEGVAPTRDYFKVQDESGRWLWIYRTLETGRWFVHGLWA